MNSTILASLFHLISLSVIGEYVDHLRSKERPLFVVDAIKPRELDGTVPGSSGILPRARTPRSAAGLQSPTITAQDRHLDPS